MQGIQPIMFILLMFGVFWFVLIRPQMKRQKEHAAMLSALKRGDMVVTRGGLVGKITGLSETTITLELQEKVRVRVMRGFIENKYDESKDKVVAEAKAA